MTLCDNLSNGFEQAQYMVAHSHILEKCTNLSSGLWSGLRHAHLLGMYVLAAQARTACNNTWTLTAHLKNGTIRE